jgi:hypothetical protein
MLLRRHPRRLIGRPPGPFRLVGARLIGEMVPHPLEDQRRDQRARLRNASVRGSLQKHLGEVDGIKNLKPRVAEPGWIGLEDIRHLSLS